MTVWQAVLIGLYHYVINCKYFILTQGQFVLGRPLISGLAVGIIMGRPVEGLIIGANINLVYLGWMDVGGMRATDPAVAGTLGTALALASNASPEEAIVLGSILGFICAIYFNMNMIVLAILAAIAAVIAIFGVGIPARKGESE